MVRPGDGQESSRWSGDRPQGFVASLVSSARANPLWYLFVAASLAVAFFGIIGGNLHGNIGQVMSLARQEAGPSDGLVSAQATALFLGTIVMAVILVIVLPALVALILMGMQESRAYLRRLEDSSAMLPGVEPEVLRRALQAMPALASRALEPVAPSERMPEQEVRRVFSEELSKARAGLQGESVAEIKAMVQQMVHEALGAQPRVEPPRPSYDDVRRWVREEVSGTLAGSQPPAPPQPAPAAVAGVGARSLARYHQLVRSLDAPFHREKDRQTLVMAPFWYLYPQALYETLGQASSAALASKSWKAPGDLLDTTIDLLQGARDLLYDWAYELNLPAMVSDVAPGELDGLKARMGAAISEAMVANEPWRHYVALQENRLRTLATGFRVELEQAVVLRKVSVDFVLKSRPGEGSSEAHMAAWVLLAQTLGWYVGRYFSRLLYAR